MSFLTDLIWGCGSPERISGDWEHEGATLFARPHPVHGTLEKDHGSQWADWWGAPGSHKLTVLDIHSLTVSGCRTGLPRACKKGLKRNGREEWPEYVEFRKSPFMSFCIVIVYWFFFKGIVDFVKFGLEIPLQWSVQPSTLFCMLGIVLSAVSGNILPFPTQV